MRRTQTLETTIELMDGTEVEIEVEAQIQPEDGTCYRPGDPRREPLEFEDPEYYLAQEEPLETSREIYRKGDRIPAGLIPEQEEEKIRDRFEEITPTGEEMREEKELERADAERDRKKDEGEL